MYNNVDLNYFNYYVLTSKALLSPLPKSINASTEKSIDKPGIIAKYALSIIMYE